MFQKCEGMRHGRGVVYCSTLTPPPRKYLLSTVAEVRGVALKGVPTYKGGKEYCSTLPPPAYEYPESQKGIQVMGKKKYCFLTLPSKNSTSFTAHFTSRTSYGGDASKGGRGILRYPAPSPNTPRSPERCFFHRETKKCSVS